MTIGRIPSVEGGIQPTIVDAKGDILTATAADTPAVLAVGNNGETLVADSSQSTGLRWGNNYGFTAGKNKIINGDFRINQRAFSSTTTDNIFGFDRWKFFGSAGSCTYSLQTFTAGTAPVAGYEAINFARLVTAAQNTTTGYSILSQPIEDVRTFANQTITVSFWAKASTGTPKIAVELNQTFGTGGSPSANVYIVAGQATISTSWARYSVTVAIPSISGKTIGSTANTSSLDLNLWTSGGSNFDSRNGTLGVQNTTIDLWGVQVEAGSVATAFQTATGTLAGELAACQRYYVRFANTSNANATVVPSGITFSSTTFPAVAIVPVSLRTNPTSVEYSNLQIVDSGFNQYTVTNVAVSQNGNPFIICDFTASGMTAARSGWVRQSSTSGYLAFSAEL